MYIFFYISLFILLIYGLLIEYYRRSWNEMPDHAFAEAANTDQLPFVSVIVPARNEEEKIRNCIQTLLDQTYPNHLYEIIVVDDHSTDQTEMIIRSFMDSRVKLVKLSEYEGNDEIHSYKKKAIETGIGLAAGEWIMCTDADCKVPQSWISQMAFLYRQEKASFIAAPVKMSHPSGFLSIFQSLDFISLQGITGASVHKRIHSMCNGANLGYQKNLFDAVHGFEGIDHIASGDDMLLMHKIYKLQPEKVFFLKSRGAIVETEPMASWKAFLNQRIRWASKAGSYEDKRIKWVLLLVYLTNLFLLFFLFAGFWNKTGFLFFLILIFLKTLIEFPFMYSVSRFFGQYRLMKYFLFMQPLHIFYTVIAGAMGSGSGYEWKGRRGK